MPFTEGLYRLGYISKDVYEEHVRKYSTPLDAEEPKPLKQNREQQFIEERDKQLKGMLDQWEMHPDPEWREKACSFAEKYADQLQSARDILKLKKGGSHS